MFGRLPYSTIGKCGGARLSGRKSELMQILLYYWARNQSRGHKRDVGSRRRRDYTNGSRVRDPSLIRLPSSQPAFKRHFR
jgi:hypothetical protein